MNLTESTKENDPDSNVYIQLYWIYSYLSASVPLLAITALALICDNIKNSAYIYKYKFQAALIKCEENGMEFITQCKTLLEKDLHMTFFGIWKIGFGTIITLLLFALSNVTQIEDMWVDITTFFNSTQRHDQMDDVYY